MSFTKITNTQLNSRGATTLPNQPTISAQALKQEFDAPAKQIVAPAFNNLIDELQATTSAASIGATAPEGRTGTTVQGVMNSISSAVDAKSTITLSNVSTSGVRIATVVINGTSTDLKAPQGGQGTMDYDDLTDKPQINSHTLSGNQSSSDLGLAAASHTHSASDITSGLATVATSGSYSDLSNKPTIPTVTDTYSSSSHDGMSGVAVASAISGITFPVNDAFKKVKVGTYEITASDEDTIEFAQGANVTITPDVGNKKITISATGGGGGGGDMYMAVYDTNEDGIVNSADTIAGLTATVSELNILDGVTADASEINVLDGITASTAELNILNGVTASTAELNILDGVTATASELNILDGATLTTTELNYVDGVTSAIQTQLNDKAASSHTHTLSIASDSGTSALDLAANTKYKLTAGGSTFIFKTPEDTGNDMIPVSGDISAVASLSDGNDNYVINAYTAKRWSNCDDIQLLVAVSVDDDGIGTWEDDDTWETSGVRTGWIQHASLHGILSDDDVEIEPVFKVPSGTENAVSLYAMRVDDAITGSLGGVAMKFNAPITANGYAGIRIRHLRTNTIILTP